jgi:hypothetical protein
MLEHQQVHGELLCLAKQGSDISKEECIVVTQM